MTGLEAARAYASLYRPSLEQLRRELPEIGAGLAGQFDDLYARPTLEDAAALAANLAGAQREILRFREALLREGQGDGG